MGWNGLKKSQTGLSVCFVKDPLGTFVSSVIVLIYIYNFVHLMNYFSLWSCSLAFLFDYLVHKISNSKILLPVCFEKIFFHVRKLWLFKLFLICLSLCALYRKKAVLILEPVKNVHWKSFFNFIFPDVPLHFHFETLLKKTEIKGDLAENKFVGDCIISPSSGMLFTNLVFYISFISFRYVYFCFLRK